MSKSKNTATNTQSADNSVRLKHLEKARRLASGIDCTLDFIDFSNDSTEIIDDECVDSVITEDQMRGIFLVTESVSERLIEVKQLVHDYAAHEEEYPAIISMIDDAVTIIDAGLRVAYIHFNRGIHYDHSCPDRIGLNEIWVNGFFNTLSFANERLCLLFEDINLVCSRLSEIIKPDINGGDSGNHLH